MHCASSQKAAWIVSTQFTGIKATGHTGPVRQASVRALCMEKWKRHSGAQALSTVSSMEGDR